MFSCLDLSMLSDLLQECHAFATAVHVPTSASTMDETIESRNLAANTLVDHEYVAYIRQIRKQYLSV